MIPCSVKRHYSALLVTFETGEDLLLQGDGDQASFCWMCGLISDDDPTGPEFTSCDPTEITMCPTEYRERAYGEEADGC